MRGLLVVLLLSAATPCFAKKDKIMLDVRGDLQISALFDQEDVYSDPEYAEVLIEEGLEHLIPIDISLSGDVTGHKYRPSDESYSYSFVVIPMTDEVVFYPSETKREYLPVQLESKPRPTSKDLNRALKEKFMERKLWAMKQELAMGASPVACDLGFNTLFAWTGCLGPLGGGMALVKVMTGFRDLSRELLKAIGAIRDDEGTDPLTKYELRYAKRKRFLPESMQEVIENLFQTAYSTDKGLCEALEKLPKLLRLPIYSKMPNRQFIPLVEKHASGFHADSNSNFSEDLLELLTGHYARTVLKAGINETPKVIIGLEGPPGIGKTHLVGGIAKSLDLDFISVSLSEGLAAVFGDNKSAGSLLEAITTKKMCRNLVIFFDEADGALNDPKLVEFWKKFFDPKSPGFYSKWANAWIDLSHALFVIACNKKVTDPAIQDRMSTFVLKAPTTDQKEEVLRSEIVPNLGQGCDKTMEVTEQELGIDFIEGVSRQTIDEGYRPCQKMISTRMNKLRLQRLRDEQTVAPSAFQSWLNHRRPQDEMEIVK